MKNILASVIVLAALALPRLGHAQVGVSFSLELPAAPPLVVVEPGVQVVEDTDEEVFYVSGYYWARRDGYWYRTYRPGGRWVYVGPRGVPVALHHITPGHYRRWRRGMVHYHHVDGYRRRDYRGYHGGPHRYEPRGEYRPAPERHSPRPVHQAPVHRAPVHQAPVHQAPSHQGSSPHHGHH